MKTFADAIFTAEQFTTKKEKFDALSGLDADGQRLLMEALNPYRVFNVRKWDSPMAFANEDPPTFINFFNLLDALHDRVVTGATARDSVTAVMGHFTQRTAEALERVILKDLKCGANATTIEAVYPNLKVPGFSLMLCSKIEHVKNERGEIIYPNYKWTFPCQGEVKYDGMRFVAMVENGNIEYFSRSGKPADQWKGLFDDELIKMEGYCGIPIIVDGEALSIDGFAATAKAKGSKNDKSGMRFFVFDWMTLGDWKAQRCAIEQNERTSGLTLVIEKLGLTKIIKSKHKILRNMEEAKAFYDEVIELGLPGQDEGLIIKKLNGLYEWNSLTKRSETWSKWKPVIDVDVTIVGTYEGKVGTKNEGRLGGFLVEGEDENGNKIKSRCGGFKVNSKKFKDWIAVFDKQHNLGMAALLESGMSRDEFFRTLAWKRPELFMGQTCMIETQELSRAQDSDTFALRFPQFIMLRDDK